MTNITGSEINFLIHRYLQESGCQHSAFIFKHESRLEKEQFPTANLPPQALITILKKGMFYMQLEKSIAEKAKSNNSIENIVLSITECVRKEEGIISSKPSQSNKNRNDMSSMSDKKPSGEVKGFNIQRGEVLVMNDHCQEAYCLKWSNNSDFLATGSKDGMVIIYHLLDGKLQIKHKLDHASSKERENKEITAMDWSCDDTIIATGCNDGTTRLYNTSGTHLCSLSDQGGPIHALKFSPDGKYLACSTLKNNIVLYDMNKKAPYLYFNHHKMTIYDIDWRDDDSFASCSCDHCICVWKIGQNTPIHVYTDHKSEVNNVEWNCSRKLLLSCSDDKTINIYSPFEDNQQTMTLYGHSMCVYVAKWHPKHPDILVSGSYDKTIRIWNISEGPNAIHVIEKHEGRIFTITFSPDGDYFASGGSDHYLHIWRTCDGALVDSYNTGGVIFMAAWCPNGAKIAVCLGNGQVHVISINAK